MKLEPAQLQSLTLELASRADVLATRKEFVQVLHAPSQHLGVDLNVSASRPARATDLNDQRDTLAQRTLANEGLNCPQDLQKTIAQRTGRCIRGR